MSRLRPLMAMLCVVTLVSFVFVNMGNALLVDALVLQGLAGVLLAAAAAFDPDTPLKRQWFAFAIGEHSGLMAMSLLLLVLGGGTRAETILALALSLAGLAMLVAALLDLRRRRSAEQPSFQPAQSTLAPAPRPVRRRSEVYFNNGERVTP